MLFDVLNIPLSGVQLQAKGCTCGCTCEACNCASTEQQVGQVGRAVSRSVGDSGANAIDPPKAL
jgi:hypothetical protein